MKRVQQPSLPDFSLDISDLEKDISVTIGQNIRNLRRIKGLTQLELSKRLALSISQLKKYERGQETPRMHHACRMALVTGMAPLYLLKNSPYQPYFPAFFFNNHVLACSHILIDTPSDKINTLFSLISNDFYYRDPDIPQPLDMPAIMAEVEKCYYANLAKNMKAWRLAKKISREAMASLLQVSPATITEYEDINSRRKFSILIAARFGAVTGDDPAAMNRDTLYDDFLQILFARLSACHQIFASLSPGEQTASLALMEQWHRLYQLQQSET